MPSQKLHEARYVVRKHEVQVARLRRALERPDLGWRERNALLARLHDDEAKLRSLCLGLSSLESVE
jgi:hypothetical protein